jgi:hypothetical protein
MGVKSDWKVFIRREDEMFTDWANGLSLDDRLDDTNIRSTPTDARSHHTCYLLVIQIIVLRPLRKQHEASSPELYYQIDIYHGARQGQDGGKSSCS